MVFGAKMLRKTVVDVTVTAKMFFVTFNGTFISCI